MANHCATSPGLSLLSTRELYCLKRWVTSAGVYKYCELMSYLAPPMRPRWGMLTPIRRVQGAAFSWRILEFTPLSALAKDRHAVDHTFHVSTLHTILACHCEIGHYSAQFRTQQFIFLMSSWDFSKSHPISRHGSPLFAQLFHSLPTDGVGVTSRAGLLRSTELEWRSHQNWKEKILN
jgi:hypothetical protein